MDFVTLSKKEEGVCQDLCLFLCTSIAAESSHVYVCQIFSSTFLHLCWQPTALLQLLQSLKPAAALAGLPFLMPPLHLLSLPLPSPPFLSLFLFLSRLKAYSHQTWLGSKKTQRLNFKGRLQVCYTHTHTLPSHFKQPSPCSEDWLLQCSQLLSESPKPDIIYARKTAI